MKNFNLLLLIGTMFLSFGCEHDELIMPTDDSENPVQIRIRNVSDFKYENVKVNIEEPTTEHGTLAKGESTAYVDYSRAFRYAYFECEINDEIFVIQPIDYVGEHVLEAGKYTYEIDASTTLIEKYGRLSLILVED